MLLTDESLRVPAAYRAGAAVGMTMAMHARKRREQEALFTVALNCWVLYLKPPIRKQHPATHTCSTAWTAMHDWCNYIYTL